MQFFQRLRTLFRKQELDKELSEELAFHIQKETEENIAAGMSAEEGRYAAIRKFGGIDKVKEECRDAWGLRLIETLFQDLRFGLRMLAKNPGFTAVAVSTLALGIGANTAIYTIVNGVMLRSLPVKNPSQLVLFYDGVDTGTHNSDKVPDNAYSYQAWIYFRDHNESFEDLCAFRQGADRLIMQVGGASEQAHREEVRGKLVAGNYFGVLVLLC